MIPQKTLTGTAFGNGVSYRIEACRRRLRIVRNGEAQTRIEEIFTELTVTPAGLNVEPREIGRRNIERQGTNEAEIT